MAAQPLVEPGGILDVAASHVRSMRQAADELHSAGIQLQGGRVPLYNMPDALDVLATGRSRSTGTITRSISHTADSASSSVPCLKHRCARHRLQVLQVLRMCCHQDLTQPLQ